eukprot:3379798-Pyramimonas_sp.AAC.1
MAGRSSRQSSDNALLPFGIAVIIMLFVILSPCIFFFIFAILCAFSPSSSALFEEAPRWRASGGLPKVVQAFLWASGGLLGVFWGPLGASSGHPASDRGIPERLGHDLECFRGCLGAILGRHEALL